MFRNLLLSFFDLTFPNFCILCSNKIYLSSYPICTDCLYSIERVDEKKLKNFFLNHFSKEKYISNFFAMYEFIKDGKFQTAIHHLKYQNKPKIGLLLGLELGKNLLKIDWFNEIDLIIPVPLYKMKKISRGYNQSLLIAKGIQTISNKQLEYKSVKRVRFTKSQTKLTIEQRRENVLNAFNVTNRTNIVGKSIIIVDDVCTTGSTSSELAKTLIQNGAKQVSLATLAVVTDKRIDV